MRKKLLLSLTALLLGTHLQLASAATPVTVNQDYLKIHDVPQAVLKQMPKNKVTVIEFFSYGCPACFHLEPDLEKWSAHLPHYVHFYRVPVEFEPDWQVYARAYYIAEQLGVARKLDHDFFVAIQQQGENLTTPEAMADFFARHGVNKQHFLQLYHASPAIDIKMQQGQQLMRKLIIFQIPTIVVDGKYKVDPSLAGANNQRLLNTVNYLIAQEAKEKHL